MSEETSPTTTITATSTAAPTEARAIVEVQRDNADLAQQNADLRRQLEAQRGLTAAAITERDGHKTRADQFAPKAQKHDELLLTVEKLTNEKREGLLLEEVRAVLPHVEPTVLRGVIEQLHEGKTVNRFAEDAKVEAGKFLEAIKTAAPSLLVKPSSGGGLSHSRGAHPTTTTTTKQPLKI